MREENHLFSQFQRLPDLPEAAHYFDAEPDLVWYECYVTGSSPLSKSCVSGLNFPSRSSKTDLSHNLTPEK